jgi:hypothetical protein
MGRHRLRVNVVPSTVSASPPLPAPLAVLFPPSVAAARALPRRGKGPSQSRRTASALRACAAGGEESHHAVGADGSSTAIRLCRQAATSWALPPPSFPCRLPPPRRQPLPPFLPQRCLWSSRTRLQGTILEEPLVSLHLPYVSSICPTLTDAVKR